MTSERERGELAAFLRWSRTAGSDDPTFGPRGPGPADFDADTDTNASDLAAFFDAFDRGDALADYDLDGEVTSLDVAAFLFDYDLGGGISTDLSDVADTLVGDAR